MANRARKTEHSGAKKGAGAFWGPKAEAKQHSRKQRRRDALADLATRLETHEDAHRDVVEALEYLSERIEACEEKRNTVEQQRQELQEIIDSREAQVLPSDVLDSPRTAPLPPTDRAAVMLAGALAERIRAGHTHLDLVAVAQYSLRIPQANRGSWIMVSVMRVAPKILSLPDAAQWLREHRDELTTAARR